MFNKALVYLALLAMSAVALTVVIYAFFFCLNYFILHEDEAKNHDELDIECMSLTLLRIPSRSYSHSHRLRSLVERPSLELQTIHIHSAPPTSPRYDQIQA